MKRISAIQVDLFDLEFKLLVDANYSGVINLATRLCKEIRAVKDDSE
jgi:hypothetical protein